MDKDIEYVMGVLADKVVELVVEGYSVRKATDMVAEAVYAEYPTIAAAITARGMAA